MAGTDYWVEISRQGNLMGAGFVLDRHHVLTASHCLRGVESDDEHLELSFADGEKAPGQVCERAVGADLALIEILKARDSAFVLPNADRASRGDSWSASYRPSTSDPYLSGDVLNGSMAYQCEAGYEIEALQLGCSQRLGDYSGYSGGPVERALTANEPTFLGVLLEQYPDRQAAGRASDVLFAATMAEALRSFNCLGANHLAKVLYPDDPTLDDGSNTVGASHSAVAIVAKRQLSTVSTTALPLEPRIADARSLISALHEWGTGGVLDPLTVSMLKLRVAQRLVDGWVDAP